MEITNIRASVYSSKIGKNKLYPIDKRRLVSNYVSELRTVNGWDFNVETVSKGDKKIFSVTRIK